MQAIKRLVQERWLRWITRRLPASDSVYLNQRRIFVFPTRTGFFYLAICILLFVLATNYQNTLVLMLSFLLIAIFVVCVHHTFLNLHGLYLQYLGAAPAYKGQEVQHRVQIQSKTRHYYQLQSQWFIDKVSNVTTIIHVDPQEKNIFTISSLAYRRGWVDPGRLRLRTVYPLGLLQSWTWVNFGQKNLVYPDPQFMQEDSALLAMPDEKNSSRSRQESEGDLYGFRQYRPGDPLSRVDWRSLARGQPLLFKIFKQYHRQDYWLDWFALEGLGQEQRLSRLCYLALHWHKQGWSFGLKMPDKTIDLGHGDAHLRTVLACLAEFGEDCAPLIAPLDAASDAKV